MLRCLLDTNVGIDVLKRRPVEALATFNRCDSDAVCGPSAAFFGRRPRAVVVSWTGGSRAGHTVHNFTEGP